MSEAAEAADEATSLFRAILEMMNSKHATTLFRLFMSLSVAGGAYFGPDLVNMAIAKSPEVVASKHAVSETQKSLDALKVSVDRMLEQQASIAASLDKAAQADQETQRSVAVLSEHVKGVEKQLDRVETKQDRDEREMDNHEK